MENDELQDVDSPEIEVQEVDEDVSSEPQPEKDWQAEAAKNKAIADRYREKFEKLKDKPMEKSVESAQPINESLIEAKVDLRIAGYSKDEIDIMQKYAKGANIPLEEAAKSEFVLSGIENMRKKAKVAQATPPSTPKVASSTNPKGTERKHLTPQEWQANRQRGNNE